MVPNNCLSVLLCWSGAELVLKTGAQLSLLAPSRAGTSWYWCIFGWEVGTVGGSPARGVQWSSASCDYSSWGCRCGRSIPHLSCQQLMRTQPSNGLRAQSGALIWSMIPAEEAVCSNSSGNNTFYDFHDSKWFVPTLPRQGCTVLHLHSLLAFLMRKSAKTVSKKKLPQVELEHLLLLLPPRGLLSFQRKEFNGLTCLFVTNLQWLLLISLLSCRYLQRVLLSASVFFQELKLS